jgi:hypothetical protein
LAWRTVGGSSHSGPTLAPALSLLPHDGHVRRAVPYAHDSLKKKDLTSGAHLPASQKKKEGDILAECSTK